MINAVDFCQANLGSIPFGARVIDDDVRKGIQPKLLPSEAMFMQRLNSVYTMQSCPVSVPRSYYYYRVLRAICCQPVNSSLICFM